MSLIDASSRTHTHTHTHTHTQIHTLTNLYTHKTHTAHMHFALSLPIVQCRPIDHTWRQCHFSLHHTSRWSTWNFFLFFGQMTILFPPSCWKQYKMSQCFNKTCLDLHSPVKKNVIEKAFWIIHNKPAMCILIMTCDWG